LLRSAVLLARCLTLHPDPGTFHLEGECHLPEKPCYGSFGKVLQSGTCGSGGKTGTWQRRKR